MLMKMTPDCIRPVAHFDDHWIKNSLHSFVVVIRNVSVENDIADNLNAGVR